jgi:peroxiredoxin
MKRTSICFFYFIILFFGKANGFSIQPNVSISFQLNKSVSGEWLYYGKSWLGSRLNDSVQIQNGSCHVNIYINKGQGDLYKFRIGDKETVDDLVFFVDPPENIRITASGGGFKNLRFSSNFHSLEDWNSYYKTVIVPLQALRSDFNKSALGDSTSWKEWRDAFHENITVTKEWIKAHPSSILGSAILVQNYNEDRMDFPADTIIYYAKLRKPRRQQDKAEQKLASLVKDLTDSKYRADMVKVEKSAVLTIGKPAPDFTIPDTAGIAVSLHDFRGKYILLNFWGSWCHACRYENPKIVAAFKQYKDKNFTVISVGLEASKDTWMQAIKKDELGQWTNVSELSYYNGKIAKAYQLQGAPYTFLIAPDGTMVTAGIGTPALDNALAKVRMIFNQ